MSLIYNKKYISFVILLTTCMSLSLGQSMLKVVDTYTSDVPVASRIDKSSAEIPAFDPLTKRVFVSNDVNKSLDVLQLESNATLSKLFSLPLSSYGGGVNAVSVSNGLVAVAVQANTKQDPGKVVIFSTSVEQNGTSLANPTVGSLPDHLAFTKDGKRIVVANEGEPNDAYTVDPIGSISIIVGPAGSECLPIDLFSKITPSDLILSTKSKNFSEPTTFNSSDIFSPKYIFLKPLPSVCSGKIFAL